MMSPRLCLCVGSQFRRPHFRHLGPTACAFPTKMRWERCPHAPLGDTVAAMTRRPIQRPIFLLGSQSGGLTLLARILRRHASLVYCTGNSRYWAGSDEMQNVAFDGSLCPKICGSENVACLCIRIQTWAIWRHTFTLVMPCCPSFASKRATWMTKQFNGYAAW